MKLRSLKVHGFKSFADSTSVDFHDGITAIVGPNGCGKSNIGDAIRWVLGEQRPTAIRGAKMEEAIFQGTVSRRPVNRGSVSVVVSNEDGALPVPFEEVEISRQVFRDGGSEYSINRSSCRLRDVVDLCRDTGLGANAYAIIENRMVDAILSDRADERRGLFEEAAGIGKYKDRRKAASRRLERAEMDLQRLEDVIGEVQTKVRSLARQKGKAERYVQYRKRRLDVEVTVARHQLEGLRERLAKVGTELEAGDRTREGLVAELSTAEAEFEALRLKEVTAEKDRSRSTAGLEAIREQLVRWERDLAVAGERATYAERRLAQIGDDRGEAHRQAEQLDGETRDVDRERSRLDADLSELRSRREELAQETEGIRERAREAQTRVEAVEARERELARRGAQLLGDAQAADAQAAELDRRIERLTEEVELATDALSDLESQGDLFTGRLDDLSLQVDAARSTVERAQADLEDARRALETARAEELQAIDKASTLGAQEAALQQLERDGEGVEPAVRAALHLRDEGVLGPLSDFMEAETEVVGAVEAYLGPLARGLVVRDVHTLERLLAWFAETWSGGGGLILLPLDRVPVAKATAGTLLDHVTAHGNGGPWVRALLAGAALAGDDGPRADLDSVAASGAVVERRGVVRVGNPLGATGVLERQERLRDVTAKHARASADAEEARAGRERSEGAAKGAEAQVEVARQSLLEVEDAHRRAATEIEARFDQRGRVNRHRDELARQLEGTRAAKMRAGERAQASREDRELIRLEEENVVSERLEAGKAAEAARSEWETARAEENRLAVEVARAEGDAARATERVRALVEGRDAARRRVSALDEEEVVLKGELAQARDLREEGARDTERLFEEREQAATEVRAKDEALRLVAEALAASERRVRDARAAERAASDRRHALELEQQEVAGRVDRVRERLEGEWGRPLEDLLDEAEPADGDPGALSRELEEIVAALERIGPVNMLAVEEHEEESQRLAFLTEQHDDLVEARNDLRSAIREINRTATDLFTKTFTDIRENFRHAFLRLFEGGEADLWLEDPDDPLESAVEIHASPKGKKTQRIDLLSGGERALTALSLLFGIYLVKPSPFCVLDEVDAPLDENNIGRFIRLLQEFKVETQFVVITHNPRTIEAADWIYGVTMEEPGVSTIVGVRLDEALRAAGGTAA